MCGCIECYCKADNFKLDERKAKNHLNCGRKLPTQKKETLKTEQFSVWGCRQSMIINVRHSKVPESVKAHYFAKEFGGSTRIRNPASRRDFRPNPESRLHFIPNPDPAINFSSITRNYPIIRVIYVSCNCMHVTTQLVSMCTSRTRNNIFHDSLTKHLFLTFLSPP